MVDEQLIIIKDCGSSIECQYEGTYATVQAIGTPDSLEEQAARLNARAADLDRRARRLRAIAAYRRQQAVDDEQRRSEQRRRRAAATRAHNADPFGLRQTATNERNIR